MADITEEPYVRVRLRPGCDGGPFAHNPADDGQHGLVSVVYAPDDYRGKSDHCVVVRFKPGTPVPTDDHLPLARYFHPDELEAIPPPP